jgi:zinc transporter ZupT
VTRPRPLLGDLRIHNAAPAGPWPQAGQDARGLELAGFIALGIGLHLGEGLAVGAALATGSAALATYLVIGFTIHNFIEGIGIAAPLTQLFDFIWLARLQVCRPSLARSSARRLSAHCGLRSA